MSTSQLRLKYLAWLLPAAALVTAVSGAGRDIGQRGLPVGAGIQTAQVQPVQAGGPPRATMPAPRPGSGWGEWWKDEQVVKELQLNPRTARDLDRIFQERSKRISAVAEELPIEQAKLDQMARDRSVDEAAYALQVARVVFLRSRRDESRQVMIYSMSLKLTPEQHKKLLEIRERGRGGRGGRGPQR